MRVAYQIVSLLTQLIALADVPGSMNGTLQRLREFRVRSLVVYVIVGVSSLLALGSAFLLEGQVAVVSFVAFLNFAAGLAIAQGVHSLGHTIAGAPEPTVQEPPAVAPALFREIAWERFLRVAVAVAAAATVFVFTAREILSPTVSAIAVGAIGSIALLAAMFGFLVAAASTLDHEREPTVKGLARNGEQPEEEPAATDDR